ncbi:hypothetical protein SAMN05216553_1198 [Lentzea fradiae]|uniref:Uncharacterized protein n=1 Tax=Lentzea fradiae TaxID=200378 RepID=A0A1G8BCP8_9PSEU|nr:hypothetical protein [Lentzea fradiae]SDH30979.1 hypothetical protein SAMN05216553_1198 [Lentzea fradiae]
MNIDGTWRLTMVTGGGEDTVELVLRSAGDALDGTFDGRPISEGKLKGVEVTFTASITSPLKAKLKCAATLDGDAMTGKAKAVFLTVPFTATRVSGDPT